MSFSRKGRSSIRSEKVHEQKLTDGDSIPSLDIAATEV